MLTFIIAIVLLIVGYFTYGKFVDRFFGPDPERPTPVKTTPDSVDYKELKPWKIFVIQFLNIAGLGPIFGAILGAAYGLMAYVWIVFGCIFMGAVHDYMSGMLSVRHGGKVLPAFAEQYMGKGFSRFFVVFACILLMAIGISFVNGPAGLLETLTSWNMKWWIYLIFLYYIFATLLPIDKIIGRFYPIMGAALLFMAAGVFVMMMIKGFSGAITLPEISVENLKNLHADPENNLLFPMLFVIISCGAISGFHSTQSPLMARCLTNEKYGRKIFYGAMITEGIVAMIWATAAISYCGGVEGLNASGKTPAILVNEICSTWLGKVGAIIAIIGVVLCPITSGDTAFRSMRLVIADAIKFDQKPILKRLVICIPIFIVAYLFSQFDFSVLWSYTGIANQILAAMVLWTCSVYLYKNGKSHWMTTIPAIFLTWVCCTYFLIAPPINGGLHLNHTWSYIMGGICALAVVVIFFIFKSPVTVVNKKSKIIYPLIAGVVIIGLIFYPRNKGVDVEVEEELLFADSTDVISYKYGIPIDNYEVVYGEVERGQTLGAILAHHNISATEVQRMVDCSKDIFNARTIRPGRAYACFYRVDTLEWNEGDEHEWREDGESPKMEYFMYEDSDEGYILFDLRNDTAYTAERGYYPVEWQLDSVAGIVETSLWNAMKRYGAEPLLAVDLSQIFGWSIDFFGLQKDDKFVAYYDRKYIEGDPTNDISVRAARFINNGRVVNAIPFMQDGEVLYFDETGNSLEGTFLKAPLEYYRITSKFTNSRFHPILKRYRPHHGVDYAAPAGTPVMAIGDGTVIEKGFDSKGGGNYVKIKHNNRYTTVYMHLQKFAPGLAVGNHVSQKEVIAYVGSTGMATGPHLDFRVYENGTAIDPLSIKSQPKAPVKEELWPEFEHLRDSVMSQLDAMERSINGDPETDELAETDDPSEAEPVEPAA